MFCLYLSLSFSANIRLIRISNFVWSSGDMCTQAHCIQISFLKQPPAQDSPRRYRPGMIFDGNVAICSDIEHGPFLSQLLGTTKNLIQLRRGPKSRIKQVCVILVQSGSGILCFGVAPTCRLLFLYRSDDTHSTAPTRAKLFVRGSVATSCVATQHLWLLALFLPPSLMRFILTLE